MNSHLFAWRVVEAEYVVSDGSVWQARMYQLFFTQEGSKGGVSQARQRLLRLAPSEGAMSSSRWWQSLLWKRQWHWSAAGGGSVSPRGRLDPTACLAH
jgi:hypothetical protein